MKKILVIDDDRGILDAFRAMLEDSDYEVITSADHEFVRKLDKNSLPDLILLDVLLSGADGRDICKMLKNNYDTMNIPVIMISAHPGAEKTLKQIGADDFLSKPFEMEELLAKVGYYMK